MITFEQADKAAAIVARKYEALSYEELQGLILKNDGVPPADFQGVDGVTVEFYTNIDQMTGRKERITVEVFVESEIKKQWGCRPCRYFEMYPDGRIDHLDSLLGTVFLWLFLIVGLASLGYFVITTVRRLW